VYFADATTFSFCLTADYCVNGDMNGRLKIHTSATNDMRTSSTEKVGTKTRNNTQKHQQKHK